MTQRGTPIESYGEGTEPVAYASIKAAANATGVPATSIQCVLVSGRPDRTGRYWRKTTPAILPGEEWREIGECHGFVFACRYEVSNQERIKGPQGPMYPSPSGDYKQIKLQIQDGAGNATSRHFRFHILAATAFHGPPPTDEHVVNHRNGRSTDNSAENLEWTTQRENSTHGCGRPVVQKNGAGDVIAQYASLTLAAEAVERTVSAICQAIRHEGKCAGFHWEHANEVRSRPRVPIEPGTTQQRPSMPCWAGCERRSSPVWPSALSIRS